ncbi:MAG: small multi-drug export protein [Lachnospiraceae bacterium]|nr:small multi-drug export protein [Lachnospiraceae bacterium]
MATTIIHWFMTMMAGLPNELIVFVVSMVPIVELRGGIICAALLGMNMARGIVFCLLGNMIPVPLILLFITPIFAWLKKTKVFRPVVEKLETRSMGKSDQIQEYQFWGLVLFVGIPLPGTGAWTGSLIAALLGVKFKKALPAVYLGLLLAVTIMCIVSYGIPALVAALF